MARTQFYNRGLRDTWIWVLVTEQPLGKLIKFSKSSFPYLQDRDNSRVILKTSWNNAKPLAKCILNIH